jgi:hypothetical protein
MKVEMAELAVMAEPVPVALAEAVSPAMAEPLQLVTAVQVVALAQLLEALAVLQETVELAVQVATLMLLQ